MFRRLWHKYIKMEITINTILWCWIFEIEVIKHRCWIIPNLSRIKQKNDSLSLSYGCSDVYRQCNPADIAVNLKTPAHLACTKGSEVLKLRWPGIIWRRVQLFQRQCCLYQFQNKSLVVFHCRETLISHVRSYLLSSFHWAAFTCAVRSASAV